MLGSMWARALSYSAVVNILCTYVWDY